MTSNIHDTDLTEIVDDEDNRKVGSSESLGTHSGASSTSRVQSARSEADEQPVNSDDEYDTDLEVEEEKKTYNLSATCMYNEACKKYGLIPVKYFLQHIEDTTVRMRHHGLGSQGAFAICIPLLTNTTLNHLDLADNWLEAGGARSIADMLKENLYITELVLSQNKIGLEGAQVICEMLEVNTTLMSIDISDNEIPDDIAENLASALNENNRLKELNMSHNELSDRTGKLVGPALADNDGLEVLDFSWNKIRRKSAQALCDSMKSNSRLKRLLVSYNGLGDEGVTTLADSLKSNNCLTDIDITCNRVHLAGAQALAKEFEANETLKTVQMGSNPIGCAGAMLILTAIGSERNTVTLLDLKNIEVDKKFKEAQTEIVKSRDLTVVHGKLLGDYVIKTGKKKNSEHKFDDNASFSTDTDLSVIG